MTKLYQISYSKESVEDIKSIGRYITDKLESPGVARNHVSRIRQDIKHLETMPMRHPLIDSDPLAHTGLRKLVVGRYVVYYLVEEKKQKVNIVRIAYGGRDLVGLMRE